MCISDFSKCELLTIAHTLAISINNELPNDDVIVLATFFTVLSDSLALLSLE